MKTETALSETRPDLSRLSKKEKLKDVRHILRLDVGVVTWITKRVAEYKKRQKELQTKVQDPCQRPRKPKRIVDYSLDSTGFEKQFEDSESETSYFSEYSEYDERPGIGDPTLLVENTRNEELQQSLKKIAKIDFQKIDVLERPYVPTLIPNVDSDDDKPKKEIPYNPYKDFFTKLPKQKQLCRGGGPVILPRVISSAVTGVIYDKSMDRKGSIVPVKPCKRKNALLAHEKTLKMQSNYLPVYGEPLQKKKKGSLQDLASLERRSSSLLKANVPLKVVEGSDGEEEVEDEEDFEDEEEEEEALFEEESYDLAMLGKGDEEADDPCVINPDVDDEYVLHPYDDPEKKSHFYETLQAALDEAGLFDDEPDLYHKYKVDTSEDSVDCCQTKLPSIPFGDMQVSWFNKTAGCTFACDGVLMPKLPEKCEVAEAVDNMIQWTKPIPAWNYKYSDADDPYLHADLVCGYYPNYFDAFDWENVNVPDDLDTFEVKQQCFPQEPLHWENMAYFKENVRCPCCETTLRDPRALQCMHIFCYKCIIMNFRVEEREGIKGYICPECEEWSDMNGYRLPSTHFIERMEDKLYSVSHCKIACCYYKYLEQFEHDFATIKCRECKNYFCEACFKEHKKDFYTSHHRYKWIGAVIFKEVNNYPVSLPFCKKHHTESVDYYCHNCRYGFCVQCKTEDHAHHVVVRLTKQLCMSLRDHINPHYYTLRDKYDKTYEYLDYMEKKINIIKNWPAVIRQAHEDVDRKEQEYLYELEVLHAKEMYKQEEAWESHLVKYKTDMDILCRALNLMEVVYDLASKDEIITLRNHWDTVEVIKALRHAHKPYPHYLNGHMRKFGDCVVNLHWIVVPSHKLVNEILAVPGRGIHSLVCSESELIAMSWSTDRFDPCSYFIRVKRHWDQNRLEKRFNATDKLYRICYYKTRDLDKIVVVERKAAKHVHPLDYRPATFMEGEIIPPCYFIRAFDRDLNGEIILTDFFDVEVTPLAICQVPGKGLCYTGIGELQTTFICLVTNPFRNGPKGKKRIYVSRDKYRPQRLDYICASRDRLAVTDTRNRDLSILDFSGHMLIKINFGYSQPKGLCMDDSENIYVAMKNENRVCKYDHNGHFVDTVVEFADGLRQPLSLHIHQEHKYQMHVGCRDGFVRIYTIPEY